MARELLLMRHVIYLRDRSFFVFSRLIVAICGIFLPLSAGYFFSRGASYGINFYAATPFLASLIAVIYRPLLVAFSWIKSYYFNGRMGIIVSGNSLVILNMHCATIDLSKVESVDVLRSNKGELIIINTGKKKYSIWPTFFEGGSKAILEASNLIGKAKVTREA